MLALADPADGSNAVDQRCGAAICTPTARIATFRLAAGTPELELEFTTPPDKMNLFGERPLHDRFGITDALLLAPGDPNHSLLLTRMRRTERGRMPPLATSVVDRRRVAAGKLDRRAESGSRRRTLNRAANSDVASRNHVW